MVGVKRSKACITCIERKKGCDGQKPICTQCQKARKVCRGYNRARTFINKVIQIKCDDSVSPTTSPVQSIESTFTKDLMQSAHENKYLGYFWQAYFPNGKPIPIEIINSGLGGWMHHVQSLCAIDNITKNCLLALSVSTLAAQDDCTTWMKVLGRRLYTSALQSVAAKLQCPRTRQADSLLASVRLLGLYEALYGEDDGNLKRATNCLAHGYGSLALVMERGPASFSLNQTQKLFTDWRLYLITISLIGRKDTFLSNPGWGTIPWEHTSKSPYDRLIDILACVPAMLEAADMMRDSSHLKHRLESWKLLRHEYLQLESKLADWHRIFGDLIVIPKQDSHAPDVVTPHHLATAQLSTLYHTACVIIYGVIGKPFIENGGDDLEWRYNDPFVSCKEILETTSLFLNPAVGLYRTHLITFPMSVTMTYLATIPPDDGLEEKALLVKCLNNESCTTTRTFLHSLMPQNFKVFESSNPAFSERYTGCFQVWPSMKEAVYNIEATYV